jgi:hypothetical protein
VAYLGLTAGAAFAQSDPVVVPAGTPTATITGTVVTSSPSELVIETPTGRQRFIVDTSSSVPQSVAVGSRVSVEYHRLDGDRMHVARVSAPSDPSLPQTASPLGSAILLGIVSLGAASILRLHRRAI